MFVSQDNEVSLSNDGPRSIDTNRCTRTRTRTHTEGPAFLRWIQCRSKVSLPPCEVISIIYRSK